jgi:hypothetical protein
MSRIGLAVSMSEPTAPVVQILNFLHISVDLTVEDLE